MELSKQEYWSGLPFPSPGDLPDPGIEPRSPTLEADALTSEPPGKSFIMKLHLNIFVSQNQLLQFRAGSKKIPEHHFAIKVKFSFVFCFIFIILF